MKSAQLIVVEWMRRVLLARQWTAECWAQRAEVAPTTITRAMRSSYNGVTSLQVLDQLARAANMPSPLDALRPGKMIVDIPDEREMLDLLTDQGVEFLRDGLRARLKQGIGSGES